MLRIQRSMWCGLAVMSLAPLAFAEEVHDHGFGPDPDHPDIEIAAVEHDGDLELEVLTGMWFSVSPDSSFADRGGIIKTADPGYPGFASGPHDHDGDAAGEDHDHDHLTLTPNTAIDFTPTGILRIFDAGTDSFIAADNEAISIYRGAGPTQQYYTRIAGTGISNPSPDSDGLPFIRVGTTNSQGILHAHVDWTLETNNGTADFGAYLVEGFVSANGYEDSAVFPILFNYGLSDEDFDLAIDSAAALYNIPEPATASLLLAGLGLIGRRRR